MSIEKLPLVGADSVSFGELPKAKTSPELKASSVKVSNFANDIMAQLKEIENNEALSPDDLDVQLYDISKKIDRMADVRDQRAVQKMYKSVVYKTFFPIVGELYGRN
jgi:TolA-binding protein